MRKEIIYSMKSIYRDDLEVVGYRFGSGRKSCCIIGGLRGNEVQQLYVGSQMIRVLKELEEEGRLAEDREILVIPCVNHYGMNIGKRFWGVDGSDINRMFPGYDKGETTQRIAAGVFQEVKDYTFGIQLSSYYMKGEFVPHVRVLATGYERLELARKFGLNYVALRTPQPFDTTTLNYNWQIWDTQAFSLYTEETQKIYPQGAAVEVEAILRFLVSQGIVEGIEDRLSPGCSDPAVVYDEDVVAVRSGAGGIYERICGQGDRVTKGQIMGRIIHPYEGYVLDEITAPMDGTVFFAHRAQMTMEHEILFKITGK